MNSVQRLRHALLRADRLLEKHEDEVRPASRSRSHCLRAPLAAPGLARYGRVPAPNLRAPPPVPPPPPQEPIGVVQGIDELGFQPGWGNTVGRVRESFQLLLDILQARLGAGQPERPVGWEGGPVPAGWPARPGVRRPARCLA